ncbi:MAG: hypothetical protein M3442_12205 [Chloroflexota bacterium]|nr:hypothetical protein [Chloroflexota bacterium]
MERTLAAGVLLAVLGGYWILAWRIEAGQEPFWSAPRVLVYSGVLTILGACAVAFSGRRHRETAVGTTTANGRSRAVATIAALGVGLVVAAGPISGAWSRLYGVDLALWSAPPLLFLAGIALAAFGALAGFTWETTQHDPTRRSTLWRATRIDALPWAQGETGLYLAAGLLLAVVTGVVAEYDFDVAPHDALYHPILLCGTSALVLTAAVRAAGRIGGATLAATAYTAVRLLAQAEVGALTGIRPQIPLLLVAAPAIDLALWRLSLAISRRASVPGHGERAWIVAPLTGVAFTATLLLVQWPYTVAANAVVWGPDVLAVAALPALLAGAAGASLGWYFGARLRPIGQRPASAPEPPRPARTFVGPAVVVALALAGLCAVAIVPALVNRGAPLAWSASTARGTVVGTLELTPAVPIAGQPLSVRLTVTDPFLIAGPTLLPFETQRLGDVAAGNLSAASQPGVYQGTFTPREPGRRRLSVFLQIQEVRTAASATFVVYRPEDAPPTAPQPARSVVLRPQPAPELDIPLWLQPLTLAILAGLLGGAAVGTHLALRRARQSAALTRAVPSPSRLS